MKTTLRIFRIISKLLLLAYVTIVNFVFITVFYALLLSILRHIWPAYIPGLFDEGVIPYLVNTLPYYLLLLFILYSISPLNVRVIRRKEGYRPKNSSDRMRVERLLSEMGMNRKLKLYRNNDARVNAAAFGFNTIGLTGGVLAAVSDEELKGIISHEVGHISHYDFVYQVLLFSMESFGYRCLYGIFLIPALIFGIIGSMVFALVPALGFVGELIAKLWWAVYKLLHRIIYGISRITDVNINKYAEYRCDAYAEKYGCKYVEGARPWGEKADIALPSATQNELNGDDAKTLVANGVIAVSEGANMPSTPEAIKVFQDAKILYAPGKAANAGGVSVSGLEMTQNSIKLSWSAEEVDEKLKSIMKNIHEACVQYGTEADGYVNYVKGANVAGFMKVAKAMMAQGIV